MVMSVLNSILGAEPSLEMPLVQAGLDSLGTILLPYWFDMCITNLIHGMTHCMQASHHAFRSMLSDSVVWALQAQWKSAMRSASSWGLSCPAHWYLTTPLSHQCANLSAHLLLQFQVGIIPPCRSDGFIWKAILPRDNF